MRNKSVNIVYEDDQILILNKAGGLLTIGTPKDKEHNLYHYAAEYVKYRNKNNKVFIVNRLDKWTSGIVVFAKSYELKIKLQEEFEKRTVKRYYEAVVDGEVNGKGTIKIYLLEDKFGNVFINPKGKECITNYRAVASDSKKSYIEMELVTGRKNQIRISFASINHPILGDDKYGKGAKCHSKYMMLNSYKIEFPPSIGLKKCSFEIERRYRDLFKKQLGK